VISLARRTLPRQDCFSHKYFNAAGQRQAGTSTSLKTTRETGACTEKPATKQARAPAGRQAHWHHKARREPGHGQQAKAATRAVSAAYRCTSYSPHRQLRRKLGPASEPSRMLPVWSASCSRTPGPNAGNTRPAVGCRRLSLALSFSFRLRARPLFVSAAACRFCRCLPLPALCPCLALPANPFP
jgi:hypothetical protein